MLTLSTGYDFEASSDQRTARFGDEVVGKIFPIEEEREAVRKITAYLLYGKAPLKALFIATDVLGGYNAKSFWFHLVLCALGDYGVASDVRAWLKGGRSENASGHDEAGARLKGKRFALCDEGLKGKSMDGNLMKSQTGGTAMPKAHRRCGQALPRSQGSNFSNTSLDKLRFRVFIRPWSIKTSI
jgi:hypothetical protein